MMKVFLSLLLFISLLPSLRAAEDCDEAPLPGPQEFYETMDQVINRLEPPPTGMSVKKCGEDEDLLKRSTALSVRMTANLLSQVKAVQTTDPSLQQNLQRATSKLECVQQKLASVKITCKDLGPQTLGFAIPLMGTAISINQGLHKSRQHLYQTTNISLEANIAGTILHEMTHKCGANDREYYDLPSDSLMAGDSWANTADVYQNWAIWGFCIPGQECTTRTAKPSTEPLASIQ